MNTEVCWQILRDNLILCNVCHTFSWSLSGKFDSNYNFGFHGQCNRCGAELEGWLRPFSPKITVTYNGPVRAVIYLKRDQYEVQTETKDKSEGLDT